MFTSRAEFRLLLRPDNADFRLTEIGYRMGLVSQKRYEHMCETKERIQHAIDKLESLRMSTSEWREKLGIEATRSQSFNKSAYQMLSFSSDNIEVQQIAGLYPQLFGSLKNERSVCDRIKVRTNFILRYLFTYLNIMDNLNKINRIITD